MHRISHCRNSELHMRSRGVLVFLGVVNLLLLSSSVGAISSELLTFSQYEHLNDHHHTIVEALNLQNEQGWLISTQGAIRSSPTIGDLDGDGDLEIVVGSDDGKVYVLHHNGTLASGWPKRTGGSIRAAPAIEDLNFDGILEIISGSSDGNVYIWTFEGSLLTGWPQQTGSSILNTPIIGDLDGDLDLDIVSASFGGKIFVWHVDGSIMAGWPQSLDPGLISSPILGDIDNNGLLDVIIGARLDTSYVFAWNAAGKSIWGWPRPVNGSIFSPAAIGELDSNPNTGLEVVVGTSTGYVYIFSQYGAVLSGWPQKIEGSATPPALGDMDGDHRLDIVIGSTSGKIYVWNVEGIPVTGWPQQTGDMLLSSPILGSIDGDPEINVLVSTSNGLYVHQSAIKPPSPRDSDVKPFYVKSSSLFHASPVLADLDQNGKLEIIISSLNGNVYVWNTNKLFNPKYLPWPMAGGNLRRNGWANDFDGDGLSNEEELDIHQTNPLSSDSDHDGFLDSHELYNSLSDPLIVNRELDTDGDGLSNVKEIQKYKTDPLTADITADTDGDGLININEVDVYGTNPMSSDTDGDDVDDKEEILYGTNPLDTNTDDDYFNDWMEIRNNQLNPLIAEKTSSSPYKIIFYLGSMLLIFFPIVVVTYEIAAVFLITKLRRKILPRRTNKKRDLHEILKRFQVKHQDREHSNVPQSGNLRK